MVKTVLPIANGSYISDSLTISAQECVNWYPNLVQSEGLNNQTLFSGPGLSLLATTGTAAAEANRGAQRLDGVPYFVNGGSLYRLESDLTTLTNLGSITGSGRVHMAENGTQLCILVPGNPSTGYIFTADPDTLTEITDSDFKANGEPQSVVYLDGYFIFTTDSKKFILSDLNNGLAYDALDFGSAESSPDPVIAAIVFRNQLYIGGSETIEAFQNVGGAGFPFVRTGLFIDKGIRAPFSIARASNTFMFLGSGQDESPAIWSFAGNVAERVSTTAIDSLLQDLSEDDINSVFAWSYSQKGAFFTGFTFPNITLVYDSVTGRWHDRKSAVNDGFGGLVQVRYRVNSLLTAYGRVLVGDSQDGRIGSMEPNTYKEYGFNIIRSVTLQHFQNNMDALFLNSLELTVESGVGDADTPEPVIGLELSKDGGKTWGPIRFRKLGREGESRNRIIWRRNGRFARFFTARLSMSDPVKSVLIQLTADIEGES